MANCVNKSLPEFKVLIEETGLHPELLAARIGVWQDNNGTDRFPSAEDVLSPHKAKEEIIYYHKSEELALGEEGFKSDLETRMVDKIIHKGYISQTKGLLGERSILHVYRNAEGKGFKPVSVRNDTVKDLHSKLVKFNNRMSNGELPFIIEKVSTTPDGIPNYTVKVNSNYVDNEWDTLSAQHGMDEQEIEDGYISAPRKEVDGYVAPHKENEIDLGHDSVEDLNSKINTLSASFNRAGMDVSVGVNGDLPSNVYGRTKGTTVEINPTYVKKDTVIHEFGHIYIDALGGMSNSFIKRGRMLLEGSNIEAKVLKHYAKGDSAISGEVLDKEILATAVGIEGAQLFESQQSSPFKTWLKIFVNKLKLALGINGNVALELANQMLNDKVQEAKVSKEQSSTDIWQYSKTSTSDEPTSKEDAHLEDVINKVYDRINIIKAKYEKTGKDVFKKEISKLLKDLEKLRGDKGLIRYVDEVSAQAEKVNARLFKMSVSEDKINPETLNSIKTYSGIFDLLKDVGDILAEEEIQAAKADDMERLAVLKLKSKKLKEAKGVVDNNTSLFDNLQKKYLVDLMAPHSKRMKFIKTQEYTKEYYRDFGRGDVKAKDTYVEEKLLENAEEISLLEREYIEGVIATAPKDISGAEAWLVDPKNLSDDLIQMSVKLLDKAEWDAMNTFLTRRNEANAVFEDLKEFRGGTSNQKTLYEGIIEKVDGKETNYLVGKYLSSYGRDLAKFWKPFNDANKKPTKKDFAKIPVLSDYKNPQWEALRDLDPEHPVRKAYDHLTQEAEEKDIMSPDAYKLKKQYKGDNTTPIDRDVNDYGRVGLNSILYKLPSIEKSSLERVSEQGLYTAVKEGLKDKLTKDSMYTEGGERSPEDIDPNLKEVLIDEQGKQNQSIPIHYRGSLNNKSQQSFDLIGVSLMDYNMLNNYHEKSKVSDTLEILNDYASKRDVQIREGGKKLINKLGIGNKSYVTTKGINSNSYKALNSIIQDRLYGISSIDMGDVKIAGKDVSINKLSNALMGWAGNTMLVLNWSAGGVNALQGKYQNFLEGATGGHYNRKDLRTAEALYLKDSGNILKDIGHKIPSSMTNLFNEKFNAFADFSGLKERFSNDNVAKRLANSGTGHFINHSGEHYIQSTVMYSVLNNIKVKDSDGSSISLHDAYIKKGDTLVLKEGITLGEDFEFNVSLKIQEVIKQLHGNYDSSNQAMAQRYVAGKFGFMLRKWMVVGTQRRWRGLRGALKKEENRSPDDLAFNSILEQDMEGYYSTFVKFMNDNGKNIRQMQFDIISGNWNQLTDQERGNIQKTIVDVGTMMLAIMASALLAGLAEDADDEDKAAYYAMAYTFRRFYSELRFYSDPGEVLKILASPAASTKMLENTGNFISQLSSPTERYVKGDRKGRLKIVREASKMLPVFSQLDRNIEDTYKWMVR